jgi:hypothetical protein
MFWSTNDSTDGAQSPFGYHRSYWTIRSSQTYIYIGYGGIEHSSLFERSSSFSNTGINWRFLAVRVTGSSGSFFKDGVKLSNFSDMPSTIDSNPTMYIGRRAFPTPYSYNGNIGNILIYNRPLSDEEIVYNYEATGKRFVSLEVQSLVVAGGGSGGQGSYPSGGGGAGGLLTGYSSTLSMNTNYTITVGAGGSVTSNGSNSVFNTFTSIGGGCGGNGRSGVGISGGSGGGGGSNYPLDGNLVNYLTPAGLGTIGQGNNGGVGKSVYNDTRLNGVPSGAGGGGGAGGVGDTGTTTPSIKAGNGGVGLYFSEYVSLGGTPSGWFAGGGGGSTSYSNNSVSAIGIGGSGGGGNGSATLFSDSGLQSTPGVINTGGGGGGGGYGSSPAAAGGSGIVILRVPDVYTAKFSSGVSWSVTKSNGYKYYKVTATSTTSETVNFS